jgi:hypothetical protein
MDHEAHAELQASSATRSVVAMIDQLEAAKRELEIADEARKARADEVARVADLVESSVGQAIEQATKERDDCRSRLREAEQRLTELEAARSRARTDRLITAPTASPTPVASGADTTTVLGTSSDRAADAAGETTVVAPRVSPADGNGSYEGSWYEVLKKQEAEANADPD